MSEFVMGVFAGWLLTGLVMLVFLLIFAGRRR